MGFCKGYPNSRHSWGDAGGQNWEAGSISMELAARLFTPISYETSINMSKLLILQRRQEIHLSPKLSGCFDTKTAPRRFRHTNVAQLSTSPHYVDPMDPMTSPSGEAPWGP